ncbi:sigma-54 dependent transcriptional regulator [bacterium]|nr:sigma-54 dependent transcriptional regulator [bacterium]
MRERRLLLFDTDVTFCDQIIQYFSKQNIEVLVANSLTIAKYICKTIQPQVILLNPTLAGNDLFLRVPQPGYAKIILTGVSDSFENSPHVYAQFKKPVDLDQLNQIVQNAFHDQEIARDVLGKSKSEWEDIVIGNFGDKGISDLIALAASVTSPVLITGETGTGKNLLARSIHFQSPLYNAPFVGINCAALPEALIEAELFGYEKGAFTSAVASKKGILEMANGGTLFLDEIGDIPLHLQSKLLNVLEEKTVRRLGSQVVKSLDFRIISSTSISLENVLGISFRKDLYYRLNVLRIHLPPLRQRRNDIPELCEYFLKRMGVDKNVVVPDSEMTNLVEYDWPGNVRELKNVLERACVFQRDHILRPSEILLLQQTKSEVWDGKSERRTLDRRKPKISTYETQAMTLADIEKAHTRIALENTHGNVTKAAKSLGISLSTMKRKIKEYGLKCWLGYLISDFCDLVGCFLQ